MPDQLITLLPIIHAGATCFMVGLIWFVQIVHYPLMRRVSADGFPAYALAHQRRTTWIVAPMMLVEAASALLLAWPAFGGVKYNSLPWIGLALLAVVWFSTFALQVPLHTRLASCFDDAACRRLVRTNWIRTFAWTARGIVALLMLQ